MELIGSANRKGLGLFQHRAAVHLPHHRVPRHGVPVHSLEFEGEPAVRLALSSLKSQERHQEKASEAIYL